MLIRATQLSRNRSVGLCVQVEARQKHVEQQRESVERANRRRQLK